MVGVSFREDCRGISRVREAVKASSKFTAFILPRLLGPYSSPPHSQLGHFPCYNCHRNLAIRQYTASFPSPILEALGHPRPVPTGYRLSSGDYAQIG